MQMRDLSTVGPHLMSEDGQRSPEGAAAKKSPAAKSNRKQRRVSSIGFRNKMSQKSGRDKTWH